MARPMIVALVLFSAPLNASACQSTSARLEAAARAQGELNARSPEVIAPEACTAHIERVMLKVGEKA